MRIGRGGDEGGWELGGARDGTGLLNTGDGARLKIIAR